jgi:uncharacterized protein (DUF2249 family)
LVFLDVRPDIAAGREPFVLIMDAVEGLGVSEELELVAPFKPIPLYRVMEARGFEWTTQRTDDGNWHITFRFLQSDE